MFEEICRPVIFEQDDEDCPYWGLGSSVLVANSTNYYWVTAAHVIDKMGGSADSLRIFPSDSSRISVPFNMLYRILDDENSSEDYKDLFVLRIDITKFKKESDGILTAHDIELAVFPADKLSKGDQLIVIGYPGEDISFDYENFKIKCKKLRLDAEYVGHSVEDHCHELKVLESSTLSDYKGLSGSPVFYMEEVQVSAAKVAIIPKLVGLLIRGTAESKIAHFINVEVLLSLIRNSENENA